MIVLGKETASPIGKKTPLKIMIARTIKRIGVKIAPTLSTTLLDFKEKSSEIPKKTMIKITLS